MMSDAVMPAHLRPGKSNRCAPPFAPSAALMKVLEWRCPRFQDVRIRLDLPNTRNDSLHASYLG